MSSIIFENGSVIKTIETNNEPIRSARSVLFTFYCMGCHATHIDYPIKNICHTRDNNMICKENFDLEGGDR